MIEACTIEAGDSACAQMSGDLTFETVTGLYLQAQEVLTPDLVSIDLSGVTAVDSAGLALLLEWQASRQGLESQLEFINAPASLLSLASLSEATGLLKIHGRDAASEI